MSLLSATRSLSLRATACARFRHGRRKDAQGLVKFCEWIYYSKLDGRLALSLLFLINS